MSSAESLLEIVNGRCCEAHWVSRRRGVVECDVEMREVW